MSQTYTNELENVFSSLPGWLQDPLRPIYNKMDEGLKWVAGDPQLLTSAGDLYVRIGQRVHDQAQQQVADRGKLAGHWEGEAYDAFCGKMSDVEASIGKIADATSRTKLVLDAAAQAAVDGANMIIEIIVAVLTQLLLETAINLALSAITFGASLLAEIAEAIVNMLTALSKIMRVVEKVAQILEKLVTVFRKLAAIFRAVENELKALRVLLDALKSTKKAYKAAGEWRKYGEFAAKHAAVKNGVSHGITLATGGTVKFPGVGGTVLDAGKDGYDAWEDGDKAIDLAQD